MDTWPAESSLTIHTPDGVSIPAVVALPSVAPRDFIVMLHGITTHKNEFADFLARVANQLGEADVASLRLDFRGHGDSEEKSRAFSVASQIVDTVTAIDWVHLNYPATRIHLLACSFGGPAALFASEWRDNLISTISLICPVLDYKRTFLQPTTEWAGALFNTRTIADAWRSGRLAMTDGFEIDLKLLVEMAALEPKLVLQRTGKSVLVVHGEADSMVPFRISQDVCAGLAHVHLVGIPRMEHGFTDIDDDEGYSAASERNLERIVSEITQIARTP